MPCYGIPMTIVADRIAELLQRQGAELIVGFPENRLLNSASLRGMRPIITRTERVAVNIADGFARASNGERLAAVRDPVRPRRGGRLRRGRAGVRRPQPDPAAAGRARDERARLDRGRPQRGGLPPDHALRGDAARPGSRARPLPPGAQRPLRRAQRPGARLHRERRAERRRGRGRLEPAAAAAAPEPGRPGRRGRGGAHAAGGLEPRDHGRSGRALRGRLATSSSGSPSAPRRRSRRR